MDDPTREHYLKLCEMASKEQDPEKLITLVEEINRLLHEKEERLKARQRSASVVSLPGPSC